MKILILRFSSIGDIVLTTPVVRALRKTYPNAEISYVTKASFADIVKANPNVTQVFSFTKHVNEVIPELKKQHFDHVVDLHRNLRSKSVIRALGLKSTTFPKRNFKKWLLVNFRINRLPAVHIVDRYFEAVKHLNVKNDNAGLDYFIPTETSPFEKLIPATHQQGYVALVLGAAHGTKCIPEKKLEFICQNLKYPVVLLGGSNEKELGDRLGTDIVYNAAGKFSVHESAQVIKNARVVVTPDTGMMHIAAAFKKPLISVWGNTIPQFGMYPYMPGNETNSVVFENKELSCRPCSKIGYKQCPKRHFKCMNDLDFENLLVVVKQRL